LARISRGGRAAPKNNVTSGLSWKDDDLLVLGGATFRLLPDSLLWEAEPPARIAEREAVDFFVTKPRRLVERYVEVIEHLEPKHIFELGIFQGGSTALLAELAQPRKLVAIDRTQGPVRQLEKYIASRGLDEVIRTYGGVDQANRRRLAQILDENFGGQFLDLVVDDCSHRYQETRASFNELFPRLRHGGAFVIEDWWWAHSSALEVFFPGQVPLTRLVFELVLALAAVPGLIEDVNVESGAVTVIRGELSVDPDEFDISGCVGTRGRELLAGKWVHEVS
jgi:SAM-dependent methyltransferase